MEVTFDAEPQVRIGWPVVETSHPDAPALSVLSWLLTGGRTSRLHRRLVIQDQVATAISSSMGPGVRFPAIFTIDATPRFPSSTDEVEAAVYAELDSLRRTPPSEHEMQRIRNQLEAGEFRRLTSNLGLALQLAGSASAFGDWRTTFGFTDRLAAVEPEDVRRVAQRFFTRETRTVATLGSPRFGCRPMSLFRPLTPKFAQVIALVWGRLSDGVCLRRKLRRRHSPRWSSHRLEFRQPDPVQHRVDPGVEVFFVEDHSLPLVSVFARFRGGPSYFSREEHGATTAVPLLLRSGGTLDLSPDSVDELLEFYAAETSFGGGGPSSFSSVNTLTALPGTRCLRSGALC